MGRKIPPEVLEQAQGLCAEIEADVFLYNAEISPGKDLAFIEMVAANRSRENALLVLVTNGGDPDSAYRISRYFQQRYEQLTVLVAGRCKSAGTLIAVGASELAFMPYGELGPLDIQMTKVDKFDRAESGLVIQDALTTLEEKARASFFEIVSSYIQANNGLLSFPAASKAASDFVTQLFAPVFARIDPEEVGARSRSMRIADDYGKRLAAKWQNVRPGTVQKLAETYSSHSFVIDEREAATLFVNVRAANDVEERLVALLANFARYQLPNDEHAFHALSTKLEPAGDQHANDDEERGEPSDGGDPQGAGGTAESPTAEEGGDGLRPLPAAAAE